MSEKLQMKRCTLCDYRLTRETDTWRRMETAGSAGKHFKVKHKPKEGECGGEMVALVAKLGIGAK